MPNKIKLRRSYTAGAVPLTSDLEVNECAINYADNKLFVRTPQNTIQAITLGGSGGSGEDALLRALFVPPAPTSLTATAGNAQVSLSWTAPTVLSVTPITDYVVQFSSNSGSTWTTFTDGTSTATSATVTGLTNGTAYVFRVAAVNGVGTGAYSSATSSVTPISGDPYFGQVALLLHADGTGSTFVDSSPYTRTITAVGNATQSAAQSRWGGKSAYFDGSGDYLTADFSQIAFGTGDFCVEFWLFITAAATNHPYGSALFDTRGVSQGFSGFCLFLNSSGVLTAWDANSVANQSAASAVPFSQWVHVVAARSSGQQRVYVNGTSVLSYSSGFNHSGVQLTIGAVVNFRTDTPDFKLQGYIDDFRITAGSSRGYTGTTIPVPTAAYPDTDANGLVPDPFFSSVALLLHADGTGSTFVDSSPTPKTITASGDATQSATQSRWGGKSAYFDGSGDYLTVPAIPLGDNFAIECWVYPVSRATTLPCIWGNYNSYASGALALFAGHLAGNTSKYQLAVNGGSFPSVQSTSDIIYGAWSHIAVVRSGNTLTLYINGATEGSMSVAGMTFGGVGPTFAIGLSQDNPSAAFHGYVDDFRITAGQSRYSGTTITAPAAAFPDRGIYEDPFMEQVSLLLHADGTGSTFVDSSLTQKTIAAVGDATQSATQSKWGGKSAVSDGSGDYITFPANAFDFAGDFTIEWWQYIDAATLSSANGSQQAIFGNGRTAGFASGMGCYIQTAGGGTQNRLRLDALVGGSWTAPLLEANTSFTGQQWQHVAITRAGSEWAMYLGGSRVATTTNGGSLSYVGAQPGSIFSVAGNGEFTSSGVVTYIDDFRITNGTARYSGTTITVPTAAFPDA
jgi:hypothetical protein